MLAVLFTRTEGAAWGHSSAGGALFSCLSSSVFPAGFNPFLFEELLLGTCCLQAMLFCQLTRGLFYCLGTGYTAGTPYKVPPTQSNTAPPPYSPSPNPYQTAMYPIRSAYPQQNLYAQVGTHGGPLLQEPPARMGGGAWDEEEKRELMGLDSYLHCSVAKVSQYSCKTACSASLSKGGA